MSRKLFAFLLSELKTVRLVCQRAGCGGVLELTVKRLAENPPAPACPLCRTEWFGPVGMSANPLAQLAAAAQAVAANAGSVQVEFVLPDPTP